MATPWDEDRVAGVIDRVDALRHEVDDHWQVPRDEARLLGQLVLLAGARRVCEIGMSYGFSTLHLTAATASLGGRLVSIDLDARKVREAGRALRDAGLASSATLIEGDARQALGSLDVSSTLGGGIDFAFIDAVKAQSDAYLDGLMPLLAPRAVLATDNTSTHADELADFVARLRSLPGASSVACPVGNGFELTLLTARGGSSRGG